MIDFWNKRYSGDEYAYGTKPNGFFKDQIKKLNPGRIFLPAEGEGRNGVYAAKLGWDVFASDISKEGMRKALALAEEQRVDIKYSVEPLESMVLPSSTFDASAFIFVHLNPEIFKNVLQNTVRSLKSEGTLIFECYSKNQLGRDSGGPKSAELLYTIPELEYSLKLNDMKILQMEEKEIRLSEGVFHNGDAIVIRAVAKK